MSISVLSNDSYITIASLRLRVNVLNNIPNKTLFHLRLQSLNQLL